MSGGVAMDLRPIQRPVRIGIVGSGFIASNVFPVIAGDEQFAVSRVVTHRRIDDRIVFPRPDLLANSPEDLIESCDIVCECSGDPIHATDVVDACSIWTVVPSAKAVTMGRLMPCFAPQYFISVTAGLLVNAVLTRRVAGGEEITFDDVELREIRALTAWRKIERVTLSESVAEVVSP
jgi:hypothetical protein